VNSSEPYCSMNPHDSYAGADDEQGAGHKFDKNAYVDDRVPGVLSYILLATARSGLAFALSDTRAGRQLKGPCR